METKKGRPALTFKKIAFSTKEGVFFFDSETNLFEISSLTKKNLIHSSKSNITIMKSAFLNTFANNSDVCLFLEKTFIKIWESTFQNYFPGLISIFEGEVKIFSTNYSNNFIPKTIETTTDIDFSTISISNGSLWLGNSIFNQNKIGFGNGAVFIYYFSQN